MRKLIPALLLMLTTSFFSFSQQTSFAYYSAYKSSGYSLTKMDEQHLFVFTGPGILNIDSSGFSPQAIRYLTSGVSNGTIRKAANGEVLMMIQHTTIGAGNGDVLFFRMDSAGNIRWIKVFGTFNKETGADFTELPNGNILLLFTGGNFSGPDNVLAMQAIDSTGSQLWQRSYTSDVGPVAAKAIVSNGNGEVYLCGNATDGGLLIKTDYSGQMLWSQSYPGGFLEDIEKSADNNDVFLCGKRKDTLEPDIDEGFIIRQNNMGQILWQRTIKNDWTNGGSSVTCLAFDPYNHHIAGGGMMHLREAQPDDDQAVTLVFDTVGNLVSSGLFGGPGKELFQELCVMNNDLIYWSGYTSGFGTDTNILVVSTGQNGSIDCLGESLVFSADTTVIPVFDPGYLQDTGNLDVISLCFPPNPESTVRMDACAYSAMIEQPSLFQGFTLVPNPNNGSAVLKMDLPSDKIREVFLYNVLGQAVNGFSYLEERAGEVIFQAGQEAGSGLYQLIVTTDRGIFQQKMLIIK